MTCSTPLSRSRPFFSSCPLSSCIVVSRVQARPSRRRRWPQPRPAAVSKLIHASVTPSASVAGSPSTQPSGETAASWLSSISRISARPSRVRRFQVNATKSRQHPSSSNIPAARSTSPALNASPNPASQVSTVWSAPRPLVVVAPASCSRPAGPSIVWVMPTPSLCCSVFHDVDHTLFPRGWQCRCTRRCGSPTLGPSRPARSRPMR